MEFKVFKESKVVMQSEEFLILLDVNTKFSNYSSIDARSVKQTSL